jgi:uncharacterized YigZ family protein
VVNKSIFIGHAFPIRDENEAKQKIDEMKNKYADATHNCSAYVISSRKIQRFDDDGEPGGTAGLPIVQAIINKGMDNIVVVVTRYFGGIKLGAGGLVRAYSKAASKVIDTAEKLEMVPGIRVILTLDYQFQGKIEHFIRSNKISIVNNEFTDRVKMVIETSMSFDELKAKLVELTSGKIELEIDDELYLPVEV